MLCIYRMYINNKRSMCSPKRFKQKESVNFHHKYENALINFGTLRTIKLKLKIYKNSGTKKIIYCL